MTKWKKQNLKPKQCSSFPKNTAVQRCSSESVCCDDDNTEIAAAMKEATSNKKEIPAGMKWASFNNIEITAGMREAAFNNTEIATGMKRPGYNTIEIAATYRICYRDEAARQQ